MTSIIEGYEYDIFISYRVTFLNVEEAKKTVASRR